MLFNIPQFIDKEDKIVGPLTAKQLGWMFGAGTVLLVLWNILDTSAFIVASVFVAGIFGALAFYQPNNQPLVSFIFSSVRFMLHPKMYVWRRIPEKITKSVKTQREADVAKENRVVNNDKIEEISRLLDLK